MATATIAAPASIRPAFFVATIFTSAFLVFLVQPMVGKLLLPLLGGSPAVWNTSMAFFQACLLLGYGYAHWLQRFPLRRQATLHLAALVTAIVALPLRVNAFGPPSPEHPNLWLLGALLLSIGAPFAVLSATAPLVQAWHARSFQHAPDGAYALYAASNVGSLLALLAYPTVVEPLLTLWAQRYGWSAGYLAFAGLIVALAFAVARGRPQAVERASTSARPDWRRRAAWIGLAAVPSSLMLGLTAFVATDVASAPFLWVAPLALYLLTFIIAFQTTPAVRPALALLMHAAVIPASALLLYLRPNVGVQFSLQTLGFFLTALVCHQALVARRPEADRLTDFYLCMSVGGVLGGAFNAFVAPVIFNDVLEYPLVLALGVLARPWARRRYQPLEWAAFALGVVALALFAAGRSPEVKVLGQIPPQLLLAALVVSGAGLRSRPLPLFGIVASLLLVAYVGADTSKRSDRSFFGVLKQLEEPHASLGGTVRLLTHGTTVHGAQALAPAYRCRPLTYYAPESAIGTTTARFLAGRPGANVGVIGLGTGALAAYSRPGDRFTFFEIDPLVVRIADGSGRFTFTRECAKGSIGFVVGDARLTLAQAPPGQYDLLLVDAFSSDSVPAHLLTVEAMRLYLSRVKPDGLLMLHISNRHMDLSGPALAAAAAAGAFAAKLEFRPTTAQSARMVSAQDVVVVSRAPATLARGAPTSPSTPPSVSPWTDDYTNIVGAIMARYSERLRR